MKQQKIIKLNAVVIHFYFQCAWMTMTNISTSDGLRVQRSPFKIPFNWSPWFGFGIQPPYETFINPTKAELLYHTAWGHHAQNICFLLRWLNLCTVVRKIIYIFWRGNEAPLWVCFAGIRNLRWHGNEKLQKMDYIIIIVIMMSS